MPNRLSFQIVANADLSPDAVLGISRLKAQHWKYPLDQQIFWMRNCTDPTDWHVFAALEGHIVSYLRLVHREARCETGLRPFLGVSTVCVDAERLGRGWGSRLLDVAHGCIQNSPEGCAVLACTPALRVFYERCGWVSHANVFVRVEDPDAKLLPGDTVMVYPAGTVFPETTIVSGARY